MDDGPVQKRKARSTGDTGESRSRLPKQTPVPRRLHPSPWAPPRRPRPLASDLHPLIYIAMIILSSLWMHALLALCAVTPQFNPPRTPRQPQTMADALARAVGATGDNPSNRHTGPGTTPESRRQSSSPNYSRSILSPASIDERYLTRDQRERSEQPQQESS